VRIRSHLVLLVLATTVPLVLFASIVIVLFGHQQRASVEREMRETAHTLSLAVDRELHASITALEALASSDYLDTGDLRRFYEQAQRVLRGRPTWNTLVLGVPSGEQVMNLFRPFGATLPARGDLTAHRQAIATRRPAISNVFIGAVTRQMVVSVEVPVVRDDIANYVLVGSIRPTALVDILTSARFSPEWTAAIVDGNKKIVARSRDAERYAGNAAGALLSRPRADQREGWLEGNEEGGAPSYAAFSRSSLSPWYVVVAVPAQALDAPLQRSLWLVAIVAVVTVMAGLALATVLGRRIARPVSRLATIATALQREDAVPPLTTPIDEVNRVSAAIGEAAALLVKRAKESAALAQAEDAARAEAEAARAGAEDAAREALRSRDALRESEERLRLTLDHALDAVIIADREGRIITCNPRAEHLFGWSRDALVGQPLADTIVPPSLRDAHRRGIERYLATGEGPALNRLIELPARCRDGTEIPVELAITPVRLGGAVIFSAFLRDISDRKRIETERTASLAREHAARAEAEAANRAKDEFLAVLSHELRTPLNAVYGWARMLQARRLTEAETERALDAIVRNTNAQVQLIDDLLDVSRIITGKMRLALRPVDLRVVVEGALDTVRLAAEAKGVELHSVLDSQALAIAGDPERLQQVVWNLLMNAVKFTPKGGRVEVHLRRGTSHAELGVSDTGQGIAPEILPFVFDRFRQADSSTTRVHAGLGLGLALVKHLVELHGGTVTAQSAGEGLGASFTVQLPLPIAEIPAGATPSPHPTAASVELVPSGVRLDGLRVLVVDDDPDAVELVSAILDRAGAAVRTALSAPHALEVLQQWRPNVLVSDVEMPGEDGYALISKVRALEAQRGGRTPAVALTAYGRTEDRMRTLSAGFSMHVPKPVDPGELTTIIASVAGQAMGR
jgi:PAS domain S-box-containing protein